MEGEFRGEGVVEGDGGRHVGEKAGVAERGGGVGGGQDVDFESAGGEVLGEAEGAHHHDAADGGEGVSDEEKTDGR